MKNSEGTENKLATAPDSVFLAVTHIRNVGKDPAACLATFPHGAQTAQGTVRPANRASRRRLLLR